ncbi:DUF3889 domain-containing protein [Fictibacillus sp. Mic-4]|uniref:DUF3889 domain-containing protein n=1 Tax=Fictibacillus TaxID=1329200 RepID=UPI00041F1B26|nr:DUF3889 domain-containing protein [Fictibacillus gelatini]
MKKIIIIFLFSLVSLSPVHAFSIPVLERAEVSYSKWGRTAVLETKKRYSDFDVVDYLYMGKEKKGHGTFQETFKLWLKKGNREMGVIVRIIVDERTDQMRSISFQKTER